MERCSVWTWWLVFNDIHKLLSRIVIQVALYTCRGKGSKPRLRRHLSYLLELPFAILLVVIDIVSRYHNTLTVDTKD